MFLHCDHWFTEAELSPDVTILSYMIWIYDPLIKSTIDEERPPGSSNGEGVNGQKAKRASSSL